MPNVIRYIQAYGNDKFYIELIEGADNGFYIRLEVNGRVASCFSHNNLNHALSRFKSTLELLGGVYGI